MTRCMELLRSVRLGRLVSTEDATLAVRPVNSRTRREQVVIRVAGGAKLTGRRLHPPLNVAPA